MKTLRWCRKCRATTDHVESPPPRLPWRWAWLAPLLWALGRIFDPPMCLLCLELDDDQGDDDDPGDERPR